MKTKLFGYDWEDIQRAQQRGSLSKPLPVINRTERAEQIRSDVERFHIPVSKAVKDQYAIVLPDGYVLQGDTWIYNA